MLQNGSAVEPVSLIFRQAKVQIIGIFFEPDWGLNNVSMERIIENVMIKSKFPKYKKN